MLSFSPLSCIQHLLATKFSSPYLPQLSLSLLYSKSQSISHISYSATFTSFCSYRVFPLRNPHFPHNFQYNIFATPLCCHSLQYIGFSLVHSLAVSAIVSSDTFRIRHNGEISSLHICSQFVIIAVIFIPLFHSSMFLSSNFTFPLMLIPQWFREIFCVALCSEPLQYALSLFNVPPFSLF